MRMVLPPSRDVCSTHAFTIASSALSLSGSGTQKLLPTAVPLTSSPSRVHRRLQAGQVLGRRLGEVVGGQFDGVDLLRGREVDEVGEGHVRLRLLLQVEPLAEAVRGQAELELRLARCGRSVRWRGWRGAQRPGGTGGKPVTAGEVGHGGILGGEAGAHSISAAPAGREQKVAATGRRSPRLARPVARGRRRRRIPAGRPKFPAPGRRKERNARPGGARARPAATHETGPCHTS